MPYLTRDEIGLRQPDGFTGGADLAMSRARAIFATLGLASDNQQMGQRWPIGCIALEVTQRCNLDCTLCYLSENSEAVKDLPLEELFRRIDAIFENFGPGTDIQVTGGEPTLRNRDELLEVVRRISSHAMRTTLMTNGIRATRSLLNELADCGLTDVAFHVDTTQQRKGYGTEIELNAVRQEYLDRAAGLPLSVMFNTTVHDANFHQIPEVVRFFRTHAGRVRTASFQLQADVGRGVAGARQALITPESVARKIEEGAGTSIGFGASLIGHPSCNQYGLCLEANGALYDAFDDRQFVARMQAATASLVLDRTRPAATVRTFALWLLRRPAHWWPVVRWITRKAWAMKADLWHARGRIRTLSFVTHNFMDADRLEADRVEACVFKTMTGEGPISMCLHNAKRDHFILRPVMLNVAGSEGVWRPLVGHAFIAADGKAGGAPMPPSLKQLKGRARQRALEARKHEGLR